MNYYRLLLVLLLPLLGMSQTQFVSFHKGRSRIHVDENMLIGVLSFEVAPGYHIQAHEPEAEHLIPSQLSLEIPTGFCLQSLHFPQAHAMLLGKKDKILVYDGVFNVEVYLSKNSQQTPSNLAIQGFFSYQACDDKRCFYPRELTFQL